MVNRILVLRKFGFTKKLARMILLILGLDIPSEVKIGQNVSFPHNAIGTVIHPSTQIDNNVRIYQNVTIGRADIYNDFNESNMDKIIIEEGAILCAGAKILSKEKVFKVGKNSIVAANSVLLNSIGENEIWAGIPAKRIGARK